MTRISSAPLRIGFAGTPQFAASILDKMIQCELTPLVVYTRPDKPRGRGRRTQANPVKALAEQQDIPIEQPPTLKQERHQQRLASYQLDLLVVAAYGLILPAKVLQTPTLGCLNVHASLLPRWRGAAPIESAIMAGDTATGICLMGMEEGLDTGPVFASREIEMRDQTLGQELESALATLGGDALVELLSQPLPDLQRVLANGQPQDDAMATYAHKLTAADTTLDWRQGAIELSRQVRALSERLSAVTQQGDLKVQVLGAQVGAANGQADPGQQAGPGQIVQANKKGIAVATGDGTLVLTLVKINRGKGNRLTPADLLNGYPQHFGVGNRFDLIADERADERVDPRG